MEHLTIYYDDYQEGIWFKSLHQEFSNAILKQIPSGEALRNAGDGFVNVLQYDRPDIILEHDNQIILVLERTVEVPSGHNVGQRFGRLVAAAKLRITVVYFGPYVAYKHGGNTAGPRYMNLRLFYALDALSKYYNTAVTTINWPVDTNYEIIKNPSKDTRVK